MKQILMAGLILAAAMATGATAATNNIQEDACVATTNVWQILPLDNPEDAVVVTTTNAFKMFTNDIPEDAFVVTATNVFRMFTAEVITHWKCPEHGVQWSALSIDDEPYCVECVYGQLIKLLKLEPMKEAK